MLSFSIILKGKLLRFPSAWAIAGDYFYIWAHDHTPHLKLLVITVRTFESSVMQNLEYGNRRNSVRNIEFFDYSNNLKLGLQRIFSVNYSTLRRV